MRLSGVQLNGQCQERFSKLSDRRLAEARFPAFVDLSGQRRPDLRRGAASSSAAGMPASPANRMPFGHIASEKAASAREQGRQG